MEKVVFFRNMKDLEMLQSHTSDYIGIVAEYHIVTTIGLSDQLFDSFCNDFQSNCCFLHPYIDDATIRHNIWNCILVTHKNSGILVVMNHYQYPRYLAILSNPFRN